MANFPTSLPSATPADHGELVGEVVAIATELGLDPSGSAYSTVAARLATLGKSARALRTAGNVTIASATWVNVDTALDLVIAAATGDILQISLGGQILVNVGFNFFIDAVTLVGGSPVNQVSKGTTESNTASGIPSWATTSQSLQILGAPFQYPVVAGDISSGSVTLRLRSRVDAAGGSGVIGANSVATLQFNVVNLGK